MKRKKNSFLVCFLIFYLLFAQNLLLFSWKKICRSYNIILVKEERKKSVVCGISLFLSGLARWYAVKKVLLNVYFWDIFQKMGNWVEFGLQTFTQLDFYFFRVVNNSWRLVIKLLSSISNTNQLRIVSFSFKSTIGIWNKFWV